MVNPSLPQTETANRPGDIRRLREMLGPDMVREPAPSDAIDGVLPAAVVSPASVEEASTILAFANERGLAVAPRGSGTKSGWGNPPPRLDLVVSTERMNQVLEHAAGDLVARMQSGARLNDVQDILREQGQRLALDPPHQQATMGGVIAAAASGPHRLRYGTPRDMLIGISYVLPDGTLARAGGRVVKNVAGYDLCKLFTGSFGTLGLLVEVIVRLHPIPDLTQTVVVKRGKSVGARFDEAVQQVLHSALVPSACDFRWGPDGAALYLLFEGVEPGVRTQADAARDLLQPFGEVLVLTGDEQDELWAQEQKARGDIADGSSALTIATIPTELQGMLGSVVASCDAQGVEWAMAGHAGSGICCAVLSGALDVQIAAIRAVRDAARRHNASVMVRDAPTAVKTAIGDVWGEAGDAFPLMRRVKERFDPNGIMNPGRFIGGL